ncbi:MAG: hypothetical protein K1X67_25730 [Fimbriimonadaceae bacterium]|nr:hypothetical protein [Fimbriimonadaceae bacterium]
MSLELILIAVLGLLVLALAAVVWILWQRPTPADSSQEVAASKARVSALSTPDLAPLHQMVSRLEAELAELKATPWRGHPARTETDSVSPDAGGTPAVQDSPLLRPEDSGSAELGGGGEGLGERSSGGLSIEIPSPDPGEGQGGGADLQPSESPDAGGTPAVQGSPLHSGGEGLGVRSGNIPSPDSGEVQGGGGELQPGRSPEAGETPAVREENDGMLPAVRMTLQDAIAKTEDLLNQTDNPTDRAYLTGLHERLVNAGQVKDLGAWDNDRTQIFGLYQQVSDIGPHELSDGLRPTAQEIIGVLDETRAEAIDHLRASFGVQVIAPVVGTPFDPLIHEDSPTTRLTPPNPNLAHTIYARVGPGLRRGDEVIERAWVKRYAGYEGPTAAIPESQDTEMHPPLPPPYPSPVPVEGTPEVNDNAAKSLLQQAAEHAD